MIESGCTHQGDEVLSPPTTNVRARFVSLHSGDIQIVLTGPGLKSGVVMVISEYSGQSDGATPVPIPNTEVKSVNVLHCTMMCEL